MPGTDPPAAGGTGRVAVKAARRPLEADGERVDCLLRLFDGHVVVLCKQRRQRLRQRVSFDCAMRRRLLSSAPFYRWNCRPSLGDRRP